MRKDTCITMFIAALFIIARTWWQPKWPSTEDWIKKICCTYTMEYYSAIQRSKIVPFSEMWIYLETVIQKK